MSADSGSDLNANLTSAKALAELRKVAVLGLNQQSDPTAYDALLQQLPAGDVILTQLEHSQNNRTGRFLEALSLSLISDQCSYLPESQTFDELPTVPVEVRPALSSVARLQLRRLVSPPGRLGFWLAGRLLAMHRLCLPDELFVQAMQGGERSESSAGVRRELMTVMSERSRWLVTLSPELVGSTTLPDDDKLPPLHQWPEWLLEADQDDRAVALTELFDSTRAVRERYLACLPSLPVALVWQLVQESWELAPAAIREQLVSQVADVWARAEQDDTPDSLALMVDVSTWLLAKRNEDRSAKVRGLLYPLCSMTLLTWTDSVSDAASSLPDELPVPETLTEAARDWHARIMAALELYMPVQRLKKPDPQPPETLTDELKALGIVDMKSMNRSQPVSRLLQLLMLAGPQRLASWVKTDSATAVRKLLKSRFGDELQTELLKTCVCYRDWQALAGWCKACPKPDSSAASALERAVQTLGTHDVPQVIETCLEGKQTHLMTNAELPQWLASHEVALEPWLSQALLQPLIQALPKTAHYYANDYLLRWAAVLTLTPEDLASCKRWQEARSKQTFEPECMDMVEAAMAFRTHMNESNTDTHHQGEQP